MIYLAHVGDHELDPDADGPWLELRPLLPGLLFVDSPERRSVVYHAIKDELPPGSPLLVTELTEVPKFKGMAPGALRWARERLGG